MKIINSIKQVFSLKLFFLVLILFYIIYHMLFFSSLSFYFASTGLTLWYQNMIATLLPFMILSTFMIRLQISDFVMNIVKPILFPFFKVNNHCLYCIVIGFSCGFPMGSKVIAQLYEEEKITKKEATFLLSFSNNIGPIYFLTFVLVVLQLKANFFLLFGMYGIPLMYGLILRHTFYRKSISSLGIKILNTNITNKRLKITLSNLFIALDDAIIDSLFAIAKLGGYMVLFNLLAFIPFIYFGSYWFYPLLYCMLEITGGISFSTVNSFFILVCLCFGGLSCLCQTASMIKKTDLNIITYFFHKIVLTGVTFCYYYFLL